MELGGGGGSIAPWLLFSEEDGGEESGTDNFLATVGFVLFGSGGGGSPVRLSYAGPITGCRFMVMLRARSGAELALHGHTFRIESINCEAAAVDMKVI